MFHPSRTCLIQPSWLRVLGCLPVPYRARQTGGLWGKTWLLSSSRLLPRARSPQPRAAGIYKISSTQWISLALLLGAATSAVAEDITLTTYYPAPRGVYKELRIGGNSAALPTGKLYILKPETDGNVALRVDDQAGDPTPFVIDQDGNVGIGLTTPTAKLDIIGAGNSSATTSLAIKDTGGTPLLVVRDDGDVGIGLTAPTAKLDIIGAGNSSATTSLAIKDTGGTPLLVVRDDGDVGIGLTAPTAKLDIIGAGNSSATTSLAVRNVGGAPLLLVRDDGNVGIGTVTPTQVLDIRDNANAPGHINFRSDFLSGGKYDTEIVFSNPATDPGAWEAGLRDNTFYIDMSGINNNLVLLGAPPYNVGIGTSTPASKLEVQGSGNASGTSSLNVTDSAGTSTLFVRDDGRVGVRTNAPVTPLDVAGAVKVGAAANSDCDFARRGSIRWVDSDVELQYCDGSVWQTIVVKTLPATCIPGSIMNLPYKTCSCGIPGGVIWEGTQQCTCEVDGITWTCVPTCPAPPLPCP